MIGGAQNGQPFRRDFAEDTHCESRSGERVPADDVFRQIEAFSDPAYLVLEQLAERLQQLTAEYRDVLRQAMAPSRAEERWREIGGQLFEWLQDQGNWGQLLVDQGGARRLEFRLRPGFSEPEQLGGIVAAAPWELLAERKDSLPDD